MTAARGGRLWRMPVVIGLLLLTVAVAVAVFQRSAGHGALDPASVDPGGTRALATILRQHGVAREQAPAGAAAAPVTAAAPASTAPAPAAPTGFVAPR